MLHLICQEQKKRRLQPKERKVVEESAFVEREYSLMGNIEGEHDLTLQV